MIAMARKRSRGPATLNIANECILKVLLRKQNDYIAKRISNASKKVFVLYLGFRTPSSEIVKLLDKFGADFSNVSIIDATGIKPVSRNAHVRYVRDCTQLTEISILLSMLMKKHYKEPVLLIVDSASSLRNYVNEEVVVKFMHYIINRSKISNVATEIMIDKKDAKSKFFNNIAQYCDRVVK